MDGRQGQQTPSLRRILRLPCRCSQMLRVEISPQCDRHGEPPSFATLNQIAVSLGIPERVTLTGTSY
jgi:hypothetical protein